MINLVILKIYKIFSFHDLKFVDFFPQYTFTQKITYKNVVISVIFTQIDSFL